MTDAPEDAFTLIGTSPRSMKTLVERRLVEHGVYAGQQAILACLWDRTASHRVSGAAHRARDADRHRPCSGWRHDLVTRGSDEHDGRLVRIWLTPRGNALRR